jgi:glycosyltransferase involved in cell wall biosynthesis
MKVLFFSHNYGAPTTTFIRNEFDFLIERANCKYLCTEITNNMNNPNVHVIPFDYTKIVSKINWRLWEMDFACNFYSRSYSKKVNEFLEEFSPDIIHCHFANEALMLLDNIDIDKYKIVVHFHGYDASQILRKKSYVRKLQKIFSHENVFAISCNEYFINSLIEKEIPGDRFFVLKYGIDVDLFKSTDETSNGRKVFLQISSFVEKKGHEFTLKAFAKFIKESDKKNFSLVFTGEGELEKHLKEMADNLGITDYVSFTGLVTPSEAVKLLNKADVFLHHSVTSGTGDQEGIPNAIIEAMAMELPILSTYHSGIPELVENSVNGYLVEERDVVNYAIKMKEVLTMGRLPKNREKIIKHHNKERHNQDLLKIYKSVLGS